MDILKLLTGYDQSKSAHWKAGYFDGLITVVSIFGPAIFLVLLFILWIFVQ